MNDDIIQFLMNHPDITIELNCRDKEGLFITMSNHNVLSMRIQHVVDLSMKDYYMDGYFQLILNIMYENLFGVIDNPIVHLNNLKEEEVEDD